MYKYKSKNVHYEQLENYSKPDTLLVEATADLSSFLNLKIITQICSYTPLFPTLFS